MAKDPRDDQTDDWVDDTEERRFREEQAHARRVARRARLSEWEEEPGAPPPRAHSKARARK